MSGLSVPVSTDSEQSYETPGYIYDHYRGRFRYVVDLAASAKNAKCPVYIDEATDSFSCDWEQWLDTHRGAKDERAAGWLNPTFSNAGKWAAKMAETAGRLRRGDVLTMLCLSNSIGTEWFKDVAPLCLTEIITPRFSYVHPDPAAAAAKWAARKPGRKPEDWTPAAPSGSMVLLFSRYTVERPQAEPLRIKHVTIKETPQ